MTDATRAPWDQLAPPQRILRLVREWEAITDPVARRLMLEELGYERIERKAARRSAASHTAAS